MSRRECTCAGVAPGYPQHEPHCGKPEIDDAENWTFEMDPWPDMDSWPDD